MKDQHRLSRMMRNGKNECFITLEDHKTNFKNNPKERLITPAKNLENQIKPRDSLRINQWNDVSEVTERLLKITDKSRYKFASSSISEKLLANALNFVKEITDISREGIQIMYRARKLFLFGNEKLWIKRGGNRFYVPIVPYNGAEVCKLLGIFMLNKISEKHNVNDLGLYRDHGLAVFKNISAPEWERIKKKFHSLFKKYGIEFIIVMQQKSSRLSRRHFQPQWWNVQAILQTRLRNRLYQCTIKPSTKHNQTATKNNSNSTMIVQQLF